jgi:hypothetical protein
MVLDDLISIELNSCWPMHVVELKNSRTIAHVSLPVIMAVYCIELLK